MSCEHHNKIFEDSWLNPRIEKRGFYEVKEYYCPDCKETFTIPPTIKSDKLGSDYDDGKYEADWDEERGKYR